MAITGRRFPSHTVRLGPYNFFSVNIAPPVATATATAPIPLLDQRPPAATATEVVPAVLAIVSSTPGAATSTETVPAVTPKIDLFPPVATCNPATAPAPAYAGPIVLPGAATATASAPTPIVSITLLPNVATSTALAPTPAVNFDYTVFQSVGYVQPLVASVSLDTTTSSSTSLTTNAAVSAGNTAFFHVGGRVSTTGSGTVVSISGQPADATVEIITATNTNANGISMVRVFCPSGMASSTTITFTLDANCTRKLSAGSEYTRVANLAKATTANTTGSGTSSTTGTTGAAPAGGLHLAAFSHNATAGGDTGTAGSDEDGAMTSRWYAVAGSSGFSSMLVESQISPTAHSSLTATATFTSSTQWVGLQASWQPLFAAVSVASAPLPIYGPMPSPGAATATASGLAPTPQITVPIPVATASEFTPVPVVSASGAASNTVVAVVATATEVVPAVTPVLTVGNYALFDTFSRSTVNGFGIADIGYTWTPTAGSTASRFATDGAVGTITNLNKGEQTHIGLSNSVVDSDIVIDWKWSANGGNNLYLYSRSSTVGVDGYRVTIRIGSTDPLPHIIIESVAASNGTQLGGGQTADLTGFVPGDQWKLRFAVVGNTMKTMAWKATDPQPTAWMISVTDNTYSSAGAFGIGAKRNAGQDNNVIFTVDNMITQSLIPIATATVSGSIAPVYAGPIVLPSPGGATELILPVALPNNLNPIPPPATATASAPTPTVSVQPILFPAAATATATAPLPALAISPSPAPPVTTATASVPAITYAGPKVLPAVVTATATAPTPIGPQDKLMLPPVATANAQALFPAVPPATATASALTPVIQADFTENNTPNVTATASALVPGIGFGVPAGSAFARVPDLVNAIILSPGLVTAPAAAPLPLYGPFIVVPQVAETATALTPSLVISPSPAPNAAAETASAPLPIFGPVVVTPVATSSATVPSVILHEDTMYSPDPALAGGAALSDSFAPIPTVIVLAALPTATETVPAISLSLSEVMTPDPATATASVPLPVVPNVVAAVGAASVACPTPSLSTTANLIPVATATVTCPTPVAGQVLVVPSPAAATASAPLPTRANVILPGAATSTALGLPSTTKITFITSLVDVEAGSDFPTLVIFKTDAATVTLLGIPSAVEIRTFTDTSTVTLVNTPGASIDRGDYIDASTVTLKGKPSARELILRGGTHPHKGWPGHSVPPIVTPLANNDPIIVAGFYIRFNQGPISVREYFAAQSTHRYGVEAFSWNGSAWVANTYSEAFVDQNPSLSFLVTEALHFEVVALPDNTRKFAMSFDGGDLQRSDVTVALNTFYRIDILADASSNVWTAQWSIDGVAQPLVSNIDKTLDFGPPSSSNWRQLEIGGVDQRTQFREDFETSTVTFDYLAANFPLPN